MYVILISIALAGYLLIHSCIHDQRNTRTDKTIFLCLVFFFLVRFNMGRDLIGYYSTWYYFRKHPVYLLTQGIKRNPAFSILMYIVLLFTGEYRWFSLVVNILSLGLCAYTILKNSRNILFSFFLFMTTGILEVYYGSSIRQMIAVSIFFYSFYTWLPKKEYKKYELFCLLALAFHETALPAFFLPLLVKVTGSFRKNPRRFLLSGIIGSGILAVLLNYLLPMLLGSVDVGWRYQNLIEYFSNLNPSILGIAMECVFLAGILLLYFSENEKTADDFTVYQVIVFLASIFLYFAFSGYNLVSRVTDLLQITGLILIPELIRRIIPVRKKTAAFLLSAGVAMFLLWSDLSANVSASAGSIGMDYGITNMPYITVFDEEKINGIFDPLDEKWAPWVN